MSYTQYKEQLTQPESKAVRLPFQYFNDVKRTNAQLAHINTLSLFNIRQIRKFRTTYGNNETTMRLCWYTKSMCARIQKYTFTQKYTTITKQSHKNHEVYCFAR